MKEACHPPVSDRCPVVGRAKWQALSLSAEEVILGLPTEDIHYWLGEKGSNLQPPDPESGALPVELSPKVPRLGSPAVLARLEGLEPPTFGSAGQRSILIELQARGGHGGIRTPNPLVRSQMLCPVELRALCDASTRSDSGPHG